MKKISAIILICIFYAFVPAYGQSEQYVGAYNGILKGLNPRLQMVGKEPIPEKQQGSPVSQAELEVLRAATLDLAKHHFLLQSAPVGSPTTDDINDYLVPAIHDRKKLETIMKGIGNGHDKFTMVPGEYVSGGTAIYAESFLVNGKACVPLLQIHFEEIAQLVNKLELLKIPAGWTSSISKCANADSLSNKLTFSTDKANDGIRNYFWLPDINRQYHAAMWQAKGAFSLLATYLACVPPVNPMKQVLYDYKEVGGAGVSNMTTMVASITDTLSTASATVPKDVSQVTFLMISTYTHHDNVKDVTERKFAASLVDVSDGKAKLESTSLETESGYNVLDEVPIGNPAATNERTDPVGDPTVGGPLQAMLTWSNPVLAFRIKFADAVIPSLSLKDNSSDGLVDTGCTCTSCKQSLESDFDKLSDCNEARFPLGIGNGNKDGIRIKAYISEQRFADVIKQSYSLHTRLSIYSDSDTWELAEVVRPSGATVVFNVKSGMPVNMMNYRIFKVDGGSSYDLKFPESGGAVYHRFTRSDSLGYYPVVQCRMEAGNSKLTTNSTGVGQWEGITTAYKDGITGGNIEKVFWALGDSVPNYNAENLVASVTYSKDGTALYTSEIVPPANGNNCTTYLQKNPSGGIEAKKEMIRNPATGDVTVKVYDTGIVPVQLSSCIVYTTSKDTSSSRVVTETSILSGKSISTATTYRSFPWGDEVIKTARAPGTAVEYKTEDEYNEIPGSNGYGKIKSTRSSNGSWTRWTYDASGRTLTVATPFVNSLFSSDDDKCRLTKYSYSATDAADFRPVQVEEYAMGVPVSRTFHAYSGTESRVIRAVSSTAAPGTLGNLVTITEIYPDPAGAPKAGRIRKVTSPDKTISVYDYTLSGGVLTTTVESGAGSGYAVTDGTRSVTVTDAAGNTSTSKEYDIASGILVSSLEYSRDEFGRTKDIVNNTDPAKPYDVSTTVNGCCGPEKETDREGLVTEMTYDGMKRVTSTTAAGIMTHYKFDPAGNVIESGRTGTDGSTFTSSSSYDAAGEMSSATDPMGNTTSYSMSAADRRQTTVFPDASQSVVKSNADGSTCEVSGSAVHLSGYDYSVEKGELCTRTYPFNLAKTYVDFLGRNCRTAYSDGSAGTVEYDNAGRPWREVSPGGITTITEYNARSEVSKTAVDLDGSRSIGENDRVTEYSRSVLFSHDYGTDVRRTLVKVNGKEASVTDVSLDGLRTWQTSYGRTTSSVTVIDRAAAAKTVAVTNTDGSTVVQSYVNGLLMKSVHSVLGKTTYTYDKHNRLSSSSQTTGNGLQTTAYSYDMNDRTVQVTENGSRSTSYQYDSMGRMTKMTMPDGKSVNYGFALTGEVVSVSGADTYPVTYAYDGAGRMENLTDGNGSTTTWNYSQVRGFMTSKRYPDRTEVKYSYNADGRVKTRTWARDLVTTYGYDNAGDLISVSYADNGRPITGNLSFTRDLFGRPTTITDSTGSRTLSYNNDSTVSLESVPYVSGHSVVYSYDNLGRRGQMQLTTGIGPLATTSYSYDSMSRLSSVGTAGILPAVSASYTRMPGSSMLATTTVSNGSSNILTVSRSYDNFNRLTTISSGSAGFQPAISYSYTYNQSDRRSKVTFTDGSSWQYGYDDKGQVTSAVRRAPDGTTLDRFMYAFDPIGNRMQVDKTHLGGKPSKSYYSSNSLNQYIHRSVPGTVVVSGEADPLAEIAIRRVSVGNKQEAFSKDAVRTGKNFSKTYTLDNSQGPVDETFNIYAVKHGTSDLVTKKTVNIFLPKTPEIYNYDPDGNLLSDGRFTYTWDGENRLVSVESIATVPATSKVKVQFAYDYQGRRVSKKSYSWATDHWQLTTDDRFVWDGWNLIATCSVTPTLHLTHTFLWGEGGLISDTDVTANKSYLAVYDGNLNIVAYVDASTGAKVASYEYDAFGRIICKSGIKSDDFNFRFSSYFFDSETGLVYYGYRYYNPETGRWLNRDPIQERGGNNLYGFVRNNPIKYFDSLGLILAAIDGTSSRSYLKDATKTSTGRWRSNVRNFHSDCKDNTKRYWHGPDNAKTGSDSPQIDKEVYEWICRKKCEDKDKPIDIVGHSRGGYIAMTVAWRLKEEGCCCNKGKSNERSITPPVLVRFLGLYDAVDMAPGYGRSEKIPNNVNNAAHALGDPDLGSRAYFNTADQGVDTSRTKYQEETFWGTHAAIGGAPWDGDHPSAGSQEFDITASIRADQFIRKRAVTAGVEINELKDADYGF